MECKNIDICMTAVLRPSLLEKTLSRIVNCIFDERHNFRLIINVDPVGEDISPEQVIKVAKIYFKNIIYNIPKEPSFPKAVKWIWSASAAPYIFHWEDDVFILKKIDISKMINILESYSDLSSLRLYKHNTPNSKSFHTFGSVWHYNEEGFYIAERWQEQFGLNPILIKREFIKKAVPLIKEDCNPEKQFRATNKSMVPLISKWKYGLYTNPGDQALVWGKEGERWKKKYGFSKERNAFVVWKKYK